MLIMVFAISALPVPAVPGWFVGLTAGLIVFRLLEQITRTRGTLGPY